MNIKDYLVYPAIFTECEEGGYMIEIRGWQGCLSQGKNFDDAMHMAKAVVTDMAKFYLDDKLVVPTAHPLEDGDIAINIPYTTALKFMFRNLCIEKNIALADIARKANISPQLLNGWLDLYKNTKLDSLALLFNVIGCPLEISC